MGRICGDVLSFELQNIAAKEKMIMVTLRSRKINAKVWKKSDANLEI